MLMRSQDKKNLFNSDRMENLQVNKDERGFCVAIYFTEDDMATIGVYSTEAKAIKVLDMIQQAYELSLYSDHGYDNSAQIMRPYMFVRNTVFQMPSDEEVEG